MPPVERVIDAIRSKRRGVRLPHDVYRLPSKGPNPLIHDQRERPTKSFPEHVRSLERDLRILWIVKQSDRLVARLTTDERQASDRRPRRRNALVPLRIGNKGLLTFRRVRNQAPHALAFRGVTDPPTVMRQLPDRLEPPTLDEVLDDEPGVPATRDESQRLTIRHHARHVGIAGIIRSVPGPDEGGITSKGEMRIRTLTICPDLHMELAPRNRRIHLPNRLGSPDQPVPIRLRIELITRPVTRAVLDDEKLSLGPGVVCVFRRAVIAHLSADATPHRDHLLTSADLTPSHPEVEQVFPDETDGRNRLKHGAAAPLVIHLPLKRGVEKHESNLSQRGRMNLGDRVPIGHLRQQRFRPDQGRLHFHDESPSNVPFPHALNPSNGRVVALMGYQKMPSLSIPDAVAEKRQ